jgi:integrase
MTSNLRTQFHNFMTIERFSDHTKRLYLRSAIGLARFYNRSPDKSHKTILLKQPPSVPIHCQKKASITRGRAIHCLRQSFATHLPYQVTDLYTIKRLLGHSSLKSTLIYLHLAPQRITTLKSPLDGLFKE